jgi:ribosomal protein S12 methylthiotransferase accessory factor
MQPGPFQLTDAIKQSTADQDKLLDPKETVRRAKERFRQAELDILSEVVRIDTGRLGIPVFLSVCGADAARLTGTAKQMGKGATPEQAEASAVMELVERFSVYSFARDPRRFIVDTYAGVREHAMDLELVARSVNDEAAASGPAAEVFASLPLRWAWGRDLTRDRPVLIPFDWFFAVNAFNGTSAGNCPEEAICQGICEVVERHVSALVWQGKRPVPAVEADSAKDPAARQMLGKYRRNGISLHIQNFSLGMGIPTVGVLAHDPATCPETSEIVWTAGTATSPEKALSRALSETAQLGGDFHTGSSYEASGLPKLKSLDEARFLLHPGSAAPISGLPDVSHPNMKTEIENCTAVLSRHEMPVFALCVTHEKLGIPSFYTLIPGARFRERAASASMAMFCGKLIAETFPPADAIARLSAMEEKLPGKYFTQFYLGLCHLAAGAAEQALPCFENALERGPAPQDTASIHSYTAVCLKELGAYEKALAAVRQGLGRDAERTDLHNLEGFLNFKLGRHQEAIRSFEQALRLNPGSAIDYANIAVNYRALGDRETAAAYFRKALELDPEIDFAREGLRKVMEE